MSERVWKDKVTAKSLTKLLAGGVLVLIGAFVVMVNHPPPWAVGLLIVLAGTGLIDEARYNERPWGDEP